MENVILADVLAYIDDHIHDKISLGELAELAGYSPFYFSKMFSEAMGMPVTGYIRIRKLQYAIVGMRIRMCWTKSLPGIRFQIWNTVRWEILYRLVCRL